jgi:ABC-type phosphate transport system substrate-binding protein
MRHMAATSRTPFTRRCVSVAVLVGALAGLVGTSGAGARPDGGAAAARIDQEGPSPVVLRGQGTDYAAAMMPDWQDALLTATAPADVRYVANGDGQLVREEFVHGEHDFIITGVPFTAEEEAELTAAGRTYVSAPIALSALALMLRAPAAGLSQFLVDEETGDVQFLPYTGPIRMPSSALYTVVFPSPEIVWRDPEFRATFEGVAIRPYPANMTYVARADAGATNRYIQEYLADIDPEAWQAAGATHGFDADVISEDWRLGGRIPTRGQVSGVANAVAQDVNPFSGQQTQGGNLGALGPQTVLATRDVYPTTDLRFVEIRNAAGEWVAPTPESIEAAFADGARAPMRAATDVTLTDAYPITWVTELVAPTTGLTVAEANALANFIRYVATDGQAIAHEHGEGALPAHLAQDALRAADAVVAGNCVGQGRLETSDRPGPGAPAGATFGGLTSMQVCVVDAPASTTTTTTTSTTTTTPSTLADSTTTTTTVASTTSTTASDDDETSTTAPRSTSRPPAFSPPRTGSGTGEGDTGEGSASTDTAPPAADGTVVGDEVASAGATETPATTALVVPAEVVDLPYALVSSTEGTGADRLTTMLLGAAAAAVVLAILRRRRGRLAPR